MNIEFLEVITKIYESRYIGDCIDGYNMLIVENKFLAELDYTYSLLIPKIKFVDPKSKLDSETRYDIDFKRSNQSLLLNNYVLFGLDKTKFIEQINFVAELRVVNNCLFQVYYYTNQAKNDGKFDIESFVPQGDNKSFKTCFLTLDKG